MYSEIQNKTVFIYTLEHPETGVVRYVGKTDNPKRRLEEHYNDKRALHKSNWVKSLRAAGLRPVMQILEEVTLCEWQEREVYWISQMRAWGFRLCNLDSGGNGPGKVSEATKHRLSIIGQGRPNPTARVPVAKYNLKGEYIETMASIHEAAASVKVSAQSLCYAIKSNSKTGGFLWQRAIDGHFAKSIYSKYNEKGKLKRSKEEINSIIKKRMATNLLLDKPKRVLSPEEIARRKRVAKRKPIIQLDLSGNYMATWNSRKDVFLELKIHQSSITACLRGKYKQAGGYLWKEA